MAETRFAALRELRRDLPAVVSPIVDTSTETEGVTPPLRAMGKSRSQEFERLTIYVRKDTKKAATRKWEDATSQDMSDLVEHLLSQYLNT